jgi:hypothetical protein
MMMSIKLVCLAATLSAVAFAAPSTLTSEDMGMRLHESHQVTSLKKQFNELQVQLKSGAEITPAVQETIQKMIDMVTNDIEPTITEAHDADQEELNALMGAVQAHNDFTEAYTAQLLEEAADLRQKMHEHNDFAEQWRLQGIVYKASIPVYEATFLNRSTVCCRREQVAVVAMEHTPAYYECDFTGPKAEACVADADASVQKYTEEPFRAGQARYTHWHTGCNNEKAQEAKDFANMVKQDKECDRLQANVTARKAYIDTEHHRFMREWHRTTTSYVPIYKKLRHNYTKNEVVSWEREETRRLEWNATQLIKCLLQGYKAGGSFDEDQMKTCEGQITDFHLYLHYPMWVCQLDYNPVLPPWPEVTDTSPWAEDCQSVANPDNTPMETCEIPADEVAPVCSNHIDQNDEYGDMTPAQALALHMGNNNDHQIGKAKALQKKDHNA